MAGDGGDEDTHVEGHDGEHDEVKQPQPDGMEESKQHGGGDSAAAAGGGGGSSLGETVGDGGEAFGEGGGSDDAEEGEEVHAESSVAGPAREEDLHALPPEEGHAHRHVAAHFMMTGHGWYSHPSHPIVHDASSAHCHLPGPFSIQLQRRRYVYN